MPHGLGLINDQGSAVNTVPATHLGNCMQSPNKRRWLRCLVWAKDYVKSNPVVSASFVSGSVGGLTLLWYCFLVGQTPDFTLSEVLGIFVAAFLAGIVVIGTFALMCVAPAAFSRYVLDGILPERPDFQKFWLPGKKMTEPAGPALTRMRSELLKGAFPAEISALAILVWSAVWLKPLAEFAWPADPLLLQTLYFTALVCLVAVICAGSQMPLGWKVMLRCVVVFTGTAAALLYVIHRAGFSSPGNLLPSGVTDAPALSHRSIHEWHFPNGPAFYAIVAALAFVVTVVIAIASLRGDHNRRERGMNKPKEHAKNRPSMAGVRIRVAAAYVVCSFLPMLAALKLADENGPAHAVRSLALLILYLALFNFMFFCVVSVRRSFGKAYLLALAFFAATLLIPIQQATIVPKIIVYVLGLGNFHSSVVVLPASECSRLQVYGVTCDPRKDASIAITNVNVISRMGSSPVLELQVRRQGPAIDALLCASKRDPGADLDIPSSIAPTALPPGQAGNVIETPLRVGSTGEDVTTHGNVTVLHPARRCDEETAAWLLAPATSNADLQANRTKYGRLLCVTITVRKDELLDYDKDGWRSYRNGYSTFVGTATPSPSAPKTPT